MKLYVIRHGQTNYNVQALCNADPAVDVHLTEIGIEQAKQVAQKLAHAHFDTIYISELPRTNETASYIAQYASTPVNVDRRLNENISGFEGKSTADYLAALQASPDIQQAKFNNGESLDEVVQRVQNFITDLIGSSQQSVLVVTHGLIVECINSHIMGLAFDFMKTFDVPQGVYWEYKL